MKLIRQPPFWTFGAPGSCSLGVGIGSDKSAHVEVEPLRATEGQHSEFENGVAFLGGRSFLHSMGCRRARSQSSTSVWLRDGNYLWSSSIRV